MKKRMILPLALSLAAFSCVNATEIGAGNMTMQFASDGKPKSFIQNGRELLNVRNPGKGFEICGFDFNGLCPITIPLNDLSYDGANLTAKNNHISITMEVAEQHGGLVFILKRVQGLSKKNQLWLKFGVNCDPSLRAVPLDYVTECEKDEEGIEVSFPWLWKRSGTVPMGSFALIPGSQRIEVPGKEAWDDRKAELVRDEWYKTVHEDVEPNVEAIRIETTKYSLEINHNGQFKSFKYGGKELIQNEKDLPEFQVCGFNHEKREFDRYRLGNARYKDGKLLVENGPFSVVFEVKAEEHYLAFKVLKTEGFHSSDLTLFNFNGFFESAMNIFPLDYMTDCGKNDDRTQVAWKWKWAKGKDLPGGGFAFIPAATDEEYDEALHHIWAKEDLPHPKVKGEWTVERSKQWVKEWQKKNMDRSRFILTAYSMDDLFYLADMAEELDSKEIYLHTDTWRGEYWPYTISFLTVNPKVFPNGEKDFQRFSGYLKEKDIGLAIHTLSCPIANVDPDYTKPTIDPRLADWIKGTLAKPASATDTTLYFNAPPGSEFPTIEKGITGPENVQPWNNIYTFQIANEFIRVESVSDTDTGVWKLNDCKRGSFKTKASEYRAGKEVRGLIRSYDQVFIPGNDTDMVEEVARRYAEFCNRNYVTHCEQDAGEVHSAENPWGYHKFTEYVYKNLDHKVTSNNSGGTPMPSQMEYQFRTSRDVVNNRLGSRFGINLHYPARVSTGPYDNSPQWSIAAASGKRTFSMEKNEPMFGITRDILSSHGLTDMFIEKQNSWKRAAKLLDAPQRKRILGQLETLYWRTATHEIFDIEKTDRGYAITPKQLMRREGIDTPWADGSEFGPITPRQYLKPGDSLELNNPYPASEPEVIIRVLSALGEGQGNSPQNGQLIVETANHVVDAYNRGAGLEESRHPLESAQHIWAADAVEGGEALSGTCWLRKGFTLNAQPVSGFLFLHADDVVTVFVNGRQVAYEGGHDAGYIVDVHKYLKKGENVLAAEVRNNSGPGCLTAALTIETSNEPLQFLTDNTWQSSTKRSRDWNQIKFDDGEWKPAHSFGTFGDAVWSKPRMVSVAGNYSLQPKATQMKEVGDYEFSDAGAALRLRYSNQRSEVIRNEAFPSWRTTGSMRNARGIGLTVDGDGSGAILVVQMFAGGHRDYIIPIDFEGRKDIVIPCGEVSWSDSRWGWRFEAKHMEYGSVSKTSLGLGMIPKETDVDIEVSHLRLLPELATELMNPEIKIGKGSLQVKGTVKTDHYLWFNGGSSVGVYDLNWNKLKDLPVVKKTFVAAKGKSSVVINTQKQLNSPWLECQFIVKDKAMLAKEE